MEPRIQPAEDGRASAPAGGGVAQTDALGALISPRQVAQFWAA